MDKIKILEAGRVPVNLSPWKSVNGMLNSKRMSGTTFLFDVCTAGLHTVDDNGYGGYTVMEDSDRELSRHLEAVRHARGRVLKTGLGLGCFVRMCLTKPEVERIDVVEINPEIAEHYGAQFAGNDRVVIHVADALEFPVTNGPWNLAWHDIYCEANEGLSHLHMKLIKRFAKVAERQGAWNLPRWAKRFSSRLI